MTKISLQNAIAQNDKWVSSRSLTAVFVGGTSGIGEYTLRSLAAHYGKSSQSLSLYLVGRNNDAASRIFNDCRKLCPSGRFTFVKASDLSLIRDVDSASDEIKKLVGDASTEKGTAACIDFLVMSHADLHIGGRRETKEGLDKTMSMLYYSRMRFAINLMPLLRASEAAHVISVFGAGLEQIKDWDAQDMSFRDAKRYNMSRARTHVVVMKTLFMEKLAVQNAGKVAFVHLFPGVVITPAFGNQDLPGWFRAMWTVAKPVVRYAMAISPEEIGERILYLASPALPPRDAPSATEKGSGKPATSTDGVIGGGAYACKHDAETIDLISKYKGLKAAKIDEKVWDHTMTVFQRIETDGVFKD
ncbi:hypothetical protein D6C85_05258 [Aureobasidium pullulans]|nr:hypothetical protein D6D01_07806 [Aureobasidium pullulans]THY97100.1 hypothetical protein D6C92_03571 [Aureobasidium pullulans]THZ71507.1 hypothetical protein D6C85_05258 [Aureobasidium pullulans]TIA17507.1 hypothetical protein D6C81_05518 [Aureobasidium pullulans]TIA50382.1 hypothetical protein D6C79_03087 [Aureobasidium pullulans]